MESNIENIIETHKDGGIPENDIKVVLFEFRVSFIKFSKD